MAKVKKEKKENPYKNFPDEIINTFSNYFDNYEDIIKLFINDIDNRLNENDWKTIYDHVIIINDKLNNTISKDYKYRTNSKWTLTNTVHEKQRKEYVSDFYNMYKNKTSNLDTFVIAYFIFQHLTYYITEISIKK